MTPFASRRSQSVASHGERKLIGAIRRWLGAASPRSPFGIGDDCAVLPASPQASLVTTDPVIFGQHFDAAVPPRAVGAKLLKRNLSDIAAMGGKPVAAVVSLALAPNTSVAWLQQFYRGLATCALRFGVRIVGGDITQAPVGFFGAFLTLHGSTAGRVITRAGARRNDHIVVTGPLGGSRLGHHHRFTPRLAEGAWLARRREVVAMMDISDGLAKDLSDLTPAGLVPSLSAAAIPVSPAARRAARRSGRRPLDHALADGEDYELLVVVRGDPRQLALAWRRRFPRQHLYPIGKFVRPSELPPSSVRLVDYHGYEHLR